MTLWKEAAEEADRGWAVPVILLFLAVTSIAIGSSMVTLQSQEDRQSITDDSVRAQNLAMAAVQTCIARLQSQGSTSALQTLNGQWQGGEYQATIQTQGNSDEIAATGYLSDGAQFSVQVVFNPVSRTLSDWREEP